MTNPLFLILAAASAHAALPSHAAVEHAVARLDMTSFPNALAGGGAPGKRLLRQFGPQRYAWSDGTLEVTEAGGGWVRSFEPLASPAGRIRLCFTDQAQNGGTYLVEKAIELSPGPGGLYRGRVIKDRHCDEFAR